MMSEYSVYIMTNKAHTVLYTGVTNDLKRRVYEHKEKLVEGFTKKYNINKLVYFEIFQDAYGAIAREKQIKGGSRRKKWGLIKSLNPTWEDLYSKL
jgi:putative endonuclease